MSDTTQTAANDLANALLAKLDAATSVKELRALSGQHGAGFARLQQVHPVRAIHIVNMTTMKRRELGR